MNNEEMNSSWNCRLKPWIHSMNTRNPTETAKKAMHIHPIFGPLNYEEWARMRFKHSIHHLFQFGLIAIA
ncbi:MAG: hypothetical protein J2P52_09665 [Blastocatellia bacterium]|nr:hypothetical protein [Blastocatellia bacterium]